LPLPPPLALFSHRHCHPPSDSRRNSCRHLRRNRHRRTVAVGCCHLPAAMVMTCCTFYLTEDYFREEACINGEKAGTPICVSAYLHICVSAYLRNNKITKKTGNNH
jgi:hypothetical protein